MQLHKLQHSVCSEAISNVQEEDKEIHKSVNVRNVKGFRIIAAFTINGSAGCR
jgi:hypothetical protein